MNYCDWCNTRFQGSYVYNEDVNPDTGNTEPSGYFCSQKCAYEARNAGFKKFGGGCAILLIALPAAGMVGALTWLLA